MSRGRRGDIRTGMGGGVKIPNRKDMKKGGGAGCK